MRARIFETVTLIGILIACLYIAAPMAQKPETRTNVSNLRSDQVRTRHVLNGAVTSGKIAFKVVAITVTTGTATTTSTADPTLVGAQIVSITPTGNQDQLIDNVALNGTGQVTVTLAANATANNTFNVLLVKANGFGVT